MSDPTTFTVSGVEVSYTWRGVTQVNETRWSGGFLMLGPTPFFLMASGSASKPRINLLLNFVSPCCGTSVSHSFRGAECKRCVKTFDVDAAQQALKPEHSTEGFQDWLDMNGWDPLRSSLVSNSLALLRSKIQVPSDLLFIKNPGHLTYMLDLMAREALGVVLSNG